MEKLTTDELCTVLQGLQGMKNSTYTAALKDILERESGSLSDDDFESRERWYEAHREYIDVIIKKLPFPDSPP